jgi:hypothetical protein
MHLQVLSTAEFQSRRERLGSFFCRMAAELEVLAEAAGCFADTTGEGLNLSILIINFSIKYQFVSRATTASSLVSAFCFCLWVPRSGEQR